MSDNTTERSSSSERLLRIGGLATVSILFAATIAAFLSFDVGAVGLFVGFCAFFVTEIVVARRERHAVLLPPRIAPGGAVATIALAITVVIAANA